MIINANINIADINYICWVYFIAVELYRYSYPVVSETLIRLSQRRCANSDWWVEPEIINCACDFLRR